MNFSWEAVGALVALVTLFLQILISWPQIARRTAGFKVYAPAIGFFFLAFSFSLFSFWLFSSIAGVLPDSTETNFAGFSVWATSNRNIEMIIGGIWLLGGIIAFAIVAALFKQESKEPQMESAGQRIGYYIFLIIVFGIPGLILCYFGWRFFMDNFIPG